MRNFTSNGSVRMPRHMPRRLRRVSASQQWRVAIVLPYCPLVTSSLKRQKSFGRWGRGVSG